MIDASVYVFDPTASDTRAQVRGAGRYLKALTESLGKMATLTSDLSEIPHPSVLIHPFFNILGPPLLTKRICAKQVAVIHDLIPLKYPRAFPIGIRGHLTLWRNKKTLPLYDRIITDSMASKDDLKFILGLPDSKITVVYPSITSRFTEPAFARCSPELAELITGRPRFFLYVGDVTWNKNLVNIARAIKLVGIPCIFAGKAFSERSSHHAWEKELDRFRKEAENNPLFVFPGYITDSDLLYLYDHATANILISRDEGFGYSYVEAAARKRPSILADRPVFREISGGHALFAQPEDPKDIADKMHTLAESPDLGKRLGNGAFERSHLFSGRRFREEMMRVIFL